MAWYAKKGSGGQGIVIDEKTGRNVAVAYDKKDSELLAAAPELLEALKLALKVFDGGGHDGMSEAQFEAKCAIAKAEGRA